MPETVKRMEDYDSLAGPTVKSGLTSVGCIPEPKSLEVKCLLNSYCQYLHLCVPVECTCYNGE